MNDEMIRQYIQDILVMADDAKREPEGAFRDGKLLAYNEVLSTLKTDLTPLGVERYGLDFDIDKKYA